MSKKIRITWVQITAILALFGILLGVIGTAWISILPTDVVSPTVQNISAEVTS